tara:strand:- start:6168 stop:6449 length:282 start_codon:yes stop_codon:yes gene_type:complete
MKTIITFLSVLLAVNFSACTKDQTCSCTTTSSATADGQPFPLFTSTNTTVSYDKKLKDQDADEWCNSYEDSATIAQSSGGFNYDVFQKTICTL